MITYFLGAGSSCKVLPLGNKLGESIMELSHSIENCNDPRLKTLTDDLRWLSQNTMKYETVDSFARHLSRHVVDPRSVLKYGEMERKIDMKGEYRRLKNALNAFLIISQHGKVDYRYNRLLSHLLSKERHSVYSLNDDVKILSWNYDNQVEIAFSSNYENSSTKDVHAMIASYPSPFLLGDKYYHIDNTNFDVFNYKVSIIHLNGVAGLFDTDHNYNIVDIINSKSEIDTILSALAVYDSDKSYLNFAWDGENQKTIELAIRKTTETDILVIIGYSLPLFNKDVDTKIFSSYSKLRKIYFQNTGRKDQDEILKELQNRGIDPSVEVIFDSNADSFKIPDELELE